MVQTGHTPVVGGHYSNNSHNSQDNGQGILVGITPSHSLGCILHGMRAFQPCAKLIQTLILFVLRIQTFLSQVFQRRPSLIGLLKFLAAIGNVRFDAGAAEPTAVHDLGKSIIRSRPIRGIKPKNTYLDAPLRGFRILEADDGNALRFLIVEDDVGHFP